MSLSDDASDVDIRRACYKAFLTDVEPKAQEILEKYVLLQQLRGGKKQTNAEQKAEFRKFFKKLKDQVCLHIWNWTIGAQNSFSHRLTPQKPYMDLLLLLSVQGAT